MLRTRTRNIGARRARVHGPRNALLAITAAAAFVVVGIPELQSAFAKAAAADAPDG